MRLLSVLIVCLCCGYSFGQSFIDQEELFRELTEQLDYSAEDADYNPQAFDDLTEMYERPLNINVAIKDDMEKMFFLSDAQINNLYSFIIQNRPLYSKYQLQGVKDLSSRDIELLMQFFVIDPNVETKEQVKGTKGYWILRDSYQDNEEDKTKYIGNLHHMYSRLFLSYGNYFKFGCTIDKDRGETFLQKGTPPIDFFSGYALYKGKEWLNTFIVGDYQVNIGQGLALWTGSSWGKGSDAVQIRKRGQGIKKYSSAKEYGFLRGVASVISYKNLDFTLFGSSNKRDASVEIDSMSNAVIVNSLSQTGYHRTVNELDRRNAIQEFGFGGNVEYRWRNLTLSGGGYQYRLEVDSIKEKPLYNRFASLSQQGSNYWMSYQLGGPNYIIFGEVAFAQDFHSAMINGVQFIPSSQVSLSLSHRYFSNNYYSVWGNSFSSSSNPSGESGLYLGLKILVSKNLTIKGYIDRYKYGWLKYQSDAPSIGCDYAVQSDYIFSPDFKVYLRFSGKEKQENFTEEMQPDFNLIDTNLKRVRLNSKIEVSSNWYLQFQINGSVYRKSNVLKSYGSLYASDVRYVSNNKKLALYMRYALFDTDDYETRIYTYENDLLYNFYTPSFSKEGSRVYVLCRWQLKPNVKWWLKIGQTWYVPEKTNGSESLLQKGEARTTLKVQLQVKY
jgi:hypothetical protein